MTSDSPCCLEPLGKDSFSLQILNCLKGISDNKNYFKGKVIVQSQGKIVSLAILTTKHLTELASGSNKAIKLIGIFLQETPNNQREIMTKCINF